MENSIFATLSVKLAGISICVLSLYWITRRALALFEKPSKQPACVSTENPSLEKGSHVPLVPLQDFNWKVKEPEKYRPFKPIYHITMALKADTPSDLITVDCDYGHRLQLRRSLLTSHGDTVHGCVPGGEDAVKELYSYLLQDYLPTRYPTIFRLSSSSSRLKNLVTNETHPTAPPTDAAAALRILGTTVEEDLFLLKPTPEGHQCVAFMCCFPSGWDPASKLGRHMVQIHANVPSYDKIGPSMERFFGKLQAGKSVKRTNWTIQTHGELFNAKGNHVKDGEYVEEEDVEIENTFLRIELQTLSRLPKSHSILFSFKTYLYPVRQIKEEGLGPELGHAIEGLQKGNAPGMWRYKGAVRWGKSVCDYLRA